MLSFIISAGVGDCLLARGRVSFMFFLFFMFSFRGRDCLLARGKDCWLARGKGCGWSFSGELVFKI
jgi:hypothetical protein